MSIDDPDYAAAYERRSVRDYVDAIRIRFFWFLVPAAIGIAATVVVVLNLPFVYRASGTILVESQQVPEDYVQATITSYVDERIQIINQRVLTRDNLLAIVRKHGLFAADAGQVGESEMVERLRSAVDVERIASGRGRTAATIAFSVAFEHADPHIAHDVTNELVTRFLHENARNRTERAAEATSFLSQEAQRLSQEIDGIENKLAQFRTANAELLPERLEFYANRNDRLEDSVRALSNAIRFQEQERSEIVAKMNSVAMARWSLGSAIAQQLRETQDRLREARARYTGVHPEVMFLQRKVADLKETIGTAPLVQAAMTDMRAELEHDPMYTQLAIERASTEERIRSLEEERQAHQSEMEELGALMNRIPDVEKELTKLQRDRDNALNKYRELRAKVMQAKLAENLETERLAERFSLLEPPVLPEVPVRPNRQLLAASGLGLSLALGAAILVLVELTDKSIRRKLQLRAFLHDDVPVVTVPFVPRLRDRIVGGLRLTANLAVTGAALAVAAYAVHIRHTPLDALWYQVLQRVDLAAQALRALL